MYSRYRDSMQYMGLFNRADKVEHDVINKRALKMKLSGNEQDVDENGVYTPIQTNSKTIIIPKEATSILDSMITEITEKCVHAETLTGGENVSSLIGSRSDFAESIKSNESITEIIPLSSSFAYIMLESFALISAKHKITIRINKSMIDERMAYKICALYTQISDTSSAAIDADKDTVGRLAERAVQRQAAEFLRVCPDVNDTFEVSDRKAVLEKAYTVAVKAGNSVETEELNCKKDIADEEQHLYDAGSELEEFLTVQGYCDMARGSFVDIMAEIMDRKCAESIDECLLHVSNASFVKTHVCGIMQITRCLKNYIGTVYYRKIIAVGIDRYSNIKGALIKDFYLDSVENPQNVPVHIVENEMQMVYFKDKVKRRNNTSMHDIPTYEMLNNKGSWVSIEKAIGNGV